jgi:hypothetical protein
VHYIQSQYDECVFYHKSTIFTVYTDDVILIDPSRDNIKDRINDFKAIFDIEVEGNLQDYLGIRIERKSDNSIHMTQPPNSINFRGLTIVRTIVKTKHQDKRTAINANTQNHDRHLWTGIHLSMALSLCHWEVNFLEKSTRPDISFVVHQLSRYSTKQKHSHGQAMKHLGCYLLGTKDKGLILQPQGPFSAM